MDISFIQQPSRGTPLEISGGHVYWVSFNGQTVLRVPRNGGGIETVANTANGPTDVMVISATVYWIDSTGVWSIRTNCETLPCADTRSQFSPFAANTSGYGMIYRTGGNLANPTYTLDWVERTVSGANNEYKIRRRACGVNTVCFNPATTIYTAATNWVIGYPISDGSHLFWSERFFNVSTPDGKIRRRPLSSGDAVDIVVNQPRVNRFLAIANGNLYFAIEPQISGQGIFRLPLTASAITRDFMADAWEITQAIQNTANAAPLVANKTTYVRFYATQSSGPNTTVVEAKLYGTRNGIDLPGSPLTPVNGLRPLRTGVGYDRARLDDGWYFLLPASWTSGTVALRAEVDPRMAHTDPNRDNNRLTANLVFQNQPPVCVWTVPVRTHTPLPSIKDPNFWAMVDRFETLWPVPDVWVFRDTNPVEELQVCWAGPFPYPCYGPYELEDGWGLTNGIPDRDKVIVSLWTRAQLSFNPDVCDDIGAPVHFMGMVHPAANNGGAAGYASTISNQSWVQLPAHTPNPMSSAWNAVSEGSTMAQELGHNHGRKHVNCNNPDDIDNNYPYPPCQLANTGPTSYYGFDVRSQMPIAPNQAADFMSYAGNRWTSDYTWRALLNKFATRTATANAQLTGTVVYAAGFVDNVLPDGKLNYLLVLPQEALPPQTLRTATRHDDAPHAIYKLRLRGANDAILHEEPLTLTPLDDHSETSDPALFSAVFNAPAGQVARVELLADGTVIDSLTPGMAAPVVAIQQPIGGAVIDENLVIEWTANDPDGDDLLFTVQYSYDGGAHWHTLITDFPAGRGGNRLALADLGSLRGSNGQTAQIRVIASDGYNTSIANSPLFSVPNRPPQPFILAPTPGQTFAAGPVVLSGGGLDPETGGLDEPALVWTVNGEPAGTGVDRLIHGLGSGMHTARLSASDGSQTVAISTTFEIAALGIPATGAPLLDGFCHDAAYADAVRMPLARYANGENATAYLLRTNNHLWACFVGLQKGGEAAGLTIDVDHSRHALAQPDDYGFFAEEDGDVITTAGNGAGGFTSPGPDGLSAQVSSDTNGWSAELRIDAAVINGMDHTIGLSLRHGAVAWPFAADDSPQRWSAATLGTLPTLTALDRYTATVASSPFTLTVQGNHFVAGVTVLWNGMPLSTTVISSEQLSATVTAAQLSSAANVTVRVQSPAPASFQSNGLPFTVIGLPPTITSLSPERTSAGSGATTLTVTGQRFAADAQVLWNGDPLPTTFVNSGQLTAQIDATRLAQGRSVGVAVRNPTPQEQISNVGSFEVEPLTEVIYLPTVIR
ncbi:MAG: IPT/TIG domain-containing protein [Caldilineaceae bacterium]|nr:IPT/TIG domain-containing protein [Caldilineaceae bacterium]